MLQKSFKLHNISEDKRNFRKHDIIKLNNDTVLNFYLEGKYFFFIFFQLKKCFD